MEACSPSFEDLRLQHGIQFVCQALLCIFSGLLSLKKARSFVIVTSTTRDIASIVADSYKQTIQTMVLNCLDCFLDQV